MISDSDYQELENAVDVWERAKVKYLDKYSTDDIYKVFRVAIAVLVLIAFILILCMYT